VADSDTVSLALTGVFGLVSSVGVLYQVLDIRQRSRASNAEAAPAGAVIQPVAPFPPAAPAGWPAPEPPTTRIAPYSGPPSPPVSPPYQPVPPLPPYQPVPPPSHPLGRPPAPPAPFPGPQPGPAVQYPPLTSFTVPPQAAAPPYYVGPPPGRVFGQPRIPRAILRARLLLLVLSVFTALSVALVFYASQVEIADPSAQDLPVVENVLFGTIAVLIVATPLSLIPTTLSILIGRGQNWARITAVVILFTQALFCSCFGAFIPFLPAGTGPNDTGEKAVVGDAILGLLGVLIGVASVAAAIFLLSKEAGGYFRAMAEWRRTRRFAR
jgi:hypothetical protein